MNIPARVGVFAIASLLACGSIPAAHATVHPPPPAEGTGDESPGSDPSDAPTTPAVMPLDCTVNVTISQIDVEFEPDVPFDEISVSVDGQRVQPRETHDTRISIERPEDQAVITVELWEDESLTGECQKTVPPPPTSEEPDPTETVDSSPNPTPEPTPSSSTLQPTQPPSVPPTSPSTPVSPVTRTPPAAPSTPSTSAITAHPRTPAPVLPGDTERAGQRPHSPGASQPEAIGPRIIRQFSDNPRDLLTRMLGIDPQTGSGLILPHPRDAAQDDAGLETLPPVSEDELNALKARLSAPDSAERTTHGDLSSADIDERVTAQRSGWVLPSLIGAACLGAAAFWLLKRRKPHH